MIFVLFFLYINIELFFRNKVAAINQAVLVVKD